MMCLLLSRGDYLKWHSRIPSRAQKLGRKSRDNLSNTYTARNPNRVGSVPFPPSKLRGSDFCLGGLTLPLNTSAFLSGRAAAQPIILPVTIASHTATSLPRLETREVLLNAGEDFVQWNLAAIVEWSRL